jgi:hypothetical protein
MPSEAVLRPGRLFAFRLRSACRVVPADTCPSVLRGACTAYTDVSSGVSDD